MARFKELNTYFKECAINCNGIGHTDSNKHFFRFNMTELTLSMSSRTNFPAMAIESSDFVVKDLSNDDLHFDRGVGFLIIDILKNPNDIEAIEDIYDSTLELVIDVLGKIHKDKNCQVAVVEHFNFDGLSINPVGPVFSNCYGWRIESGLMERAGIKYDPSKFTNEEFTDYKFK